MRLGRIYQLMALGAVALLAAGATLIGAGTAWAGPGKAGTGHHDPLGLLAFTDGTVQLQIPTPACPSSKPDCVWALFVNEPLEAGRTVIGEVTGTSGVLVVNLPHYCGVVQADALLGPRPWREKGGTRTLLDTCGSGSSTTTSSSTTSTSTSSTTTPTTTPPTTDPTTTPTTAAGGGGGGTTGGGGGAAGAASTSPTSALPFTGATSASQATTTDPLHLDAATQLPFTGADLRPFVLLGIVLVLAGALLLTTVESRRRLLRRAAAIRTDQVRDGVRRTSSWFLGL
jgi:hypothetical protein